MVHTHTHTHTYTHTHINAYTTACLPTLQRLLELGVHMAVLKRGNTHVPFPRYKWGSMVS